MNPLGPRSALTLFHRAEELRQVALPPEWGAPLSGLGATPTATTVTNEVFDAVRDANCSPVWHNLNATVTGLVTNADTEAVARTESARLMEAANCSEWNQARMLANQLRISREEAATLIRNRTWIMDPRTAVFYKSTSVEGLWIRVRPMAPFIAGGIILLALLGR